MDAHVLPSIRMNRDEPAVRVTNAFALDRADRLASLGQLAGGLAHEMNTPLASISAHAEESLEILKLHNGDRFTQDDVEELRGRLVAIMRQVSRCSRIATRLLQFAQSARRACVGSRPKEIIAAVIELFTPAARDKRVQLEQQVDKELPETDVSSAELEQLLINLVHNSLDACAQGGTIHIQATASNEQLIIRVTDTGCGIRRELLHRIFDPFFTTKPVGQGTGLGLSVCHGIVRRAGGSIEVASAPDQGTQVTITLPIQTPRIMESGMPY